MKKPKQEKQFLSAVVRLLRKARSLVAKPGGWTRGVDARSRDGEEVDIQSRAARAFCAGGACARVDAAFDLTLRDAAIAALRKTLGVRGAGSVARWNDQPRRTQKQVVAAFDKAIRLLKAI